jgi:hypothetical protein
MTIKNGICCIVASLMLIFVVDTKSAFSWEVNTHRTMNAIAMGSDFYFYENLYNLEFDCDDYCITPGRNASITIDMVERWLQEGGATEDDAARYRNHFHDPLMPWDRAGLILPWELGRRYSSSVVWAQFEKNSQEDPGKDSYSWHDAREYYYKALTGATPAERKKWFEKTFRALGQIMHLVEDAAVPEHTRNDWQHGPDALFFKKTTFEKWTDINIKDFAFFPSHSLENEELNRLFNQKGDPQAPVPISRLIDANLYQSGGRPNITKTALAGLAEYTNSNFLSDNTVFKKYMFPSLDSTEPFESTNYRRKARDGETIDHFVYEAKYRRWGRYSLDEVCYRDYAKLLVPKAIDYASRITSYFFRGMLYLVATHLSTDEEDILEIINDSSEPFLNGTLEVYRVRSDNSQSLVGTYPFNNEPVYFPCGPGGELCRYPAYSAIRLNSTGCQSYVVVYRGTLGLEENAVVGSTRDDSCHDW